MSLNVLIIPEDFRKDQYLLKPLIEAMLAALGKPQANIQVCTDPVVGGISQALDWAVIEPILDQYRGMFTVFLLLVDRDGDANRQASLQSMEGKAASYLGAARLFLAEHAWQEVEVWALAGCTDLPPNWAWKDVQSEVNPKEVYFLPYSTLKGCAEMDADGRKPIAEAAAKNYARIRQLCPMDLGRLERRLGLSSIVI